MIDLEHWGLWARWRAEGDLTMSFRSTNILWTPPRRLPVDEGGSSAPFTMITDEDLRLVDLIDKAHDAMRRRDHEGAMALLHWFGAYPGAPERRGDRVLKMGINPREARRFCERKMEWVDGWIDGFERREIVRMEYAPGAK